MMMRARVLTPVIVVSILIISACTGNGSAERMPVTTDSELARQLYETALIAYDQIKLELVWSNLENAIREDPDFFMAHFWMYFVFSNKSKDVADKAFQSNVELNDGEQLIKTSLKYFTEGQYEKVVENLKEAVDLYPKDPHIHKILYLFQYDYMKDLDGAVESMLRTTKEVPDYASVYNYLGYAYSHLEEYDLAEEALDNYLRLAPNEANPHDSKGDFYMEIGEYQKAYDSFMKAYEMDPTFFEISKKKAGKAKQMMEQAAV
jgi:tetratricopeptide (TPR) repeat protein